MIKLFICGITGAMGKIVLEMASNDEGVQVVGGIGKKEESTLDVPVFNSFDEVNIEIDCIIDFSNADIVDALVEYSVKKGIPSVICTTGLSESTELNILNASEKVALFKSGNMSVGINLITKLIKQASQVLGNAFDVEIIEKHHNRKVDSPSGTALMLAVAVNDGLEITRHTELGRPSKGSKDREIINIHSVRGGTIVGEHEVIYAGEDEILTFSHGAYSRRVFAKGALDAAKFLTKQHAGLYDMNDMLNLLLKL